MGFASSGRKMGPDVRLPYETALSRIVTRPVGRFGTSPASPQHKKDDGDGQGNGQLSKQSPGQWLVFIILDISGMLPVSAIPD